MEEDRLSVAVGGVMVIIGFMVIGGFFGAWFWQTFFCQVCW